MIVKSEERTDVISGIGKLAVSFDSYSFPKNAIEHLKVPNKNPGICRYIGFGGASENVSVADNFAQCTSGFG